MFGNRTSFRYALPDALQVGGERPIPESQPPIHSLPIITGNQSTYYIQHSPIGAHPSPAGEPIPPVHLFHHEQVEGVKADEDYQAWGAIERDPDDWDWSHHDKMCAAQRAAGLEYDAYLWLHCPPKWLQDGVKPPPGAPNHFTLFRCMEHNLPTKDLSIFDPATLQWFERYYRSQDAHFGGRLGRTYVALVGPYGEGNYPLPFCRDWLDQGHCHEGWWCNDPYAHRAFQSAMRRKYGSLSQLNEHWGTNFHAWPAVEFPAELALGPAKMLPAELRTDPNERRRWVDFMAWYHQAIPDFAEQVYLAARRYIPPERLKMKPGGSAGGVNPLYFGTYCPAFAKIAGRRRLRLQPADCSGQIFGDGWVFSSYRFYGVPLSTEPPGPLTRGDFLRRIFSDASGGASELFTYEWTLHGEDARRWIHLYRGAPSRKDAAVYTPTTWYRLNGSLAPSIEAAPALRDLMDFDVLDELPILDGALKRHRVLVAFQLPIVEMSVLEKILDWVKAGGILIARAPKLPIDVEGKDDLGRELFPELVDPDRSFTLARVGKGLTVRFFYGDRDRESEFLDLATRAVYMPEDWIPGSVGAARVDAGRDGIWTAVFTDRLLFYNTTSSLLTASFYWRGKKRAVPVEAMGLAEWIWS